MSRIDKTGLIIDTNNTNALIVRKSNNSGDLFNINASTETVTIGGTLSITQNITSSNIIVDVRDYGADPTGVADSTTAIQNAINAAMNGTRPGMVIFSGDKAIYKISSTLNISPTTSSGAFTDVIVDNQHFYQTRSIYLLSPGNCEIKVATGTQLPNGMIRAGYDNTHGDGAYYVRIEGLQFNGNTGEWGLDFTGPDTGTLGLLLDFAFHAEIHKCKFYNCTTGLLIQGVSVMTVSNCVFKTAYGLVLAGSGASGGADSLYMHNDFYCAKYQIVLRGFSGDSTIFKNQFTVEQHTIDSGFEPTGILFDSNAITSDSLEIYPYTNTYTTNLKNAQLEHFRIENNLFDGFLISIDSNVSSVSGINIINPIIKGNIFKNSPNTGYASSTIKYISLSNCKNPIISCNEFRGISGTANKSADISIELNTCYNVIVSNNIFLYCGGIHITSTNNSIIHHNTFEDVILNGTDTIYLISGCSYNIIQGNNLKRITSNSAKAINETSSSNTYNTFTDNTASGYGAGTSSYSFSGSNVRNFENRDGTTAEILNVNNVTPLLTLTGRQTIDYNSSTALIVGNSGGNGSALIVNTSNGAISAPSTNAQIILGNILNSGGVPKIDFLSNNFSANYHTRIQCYGGSATDGSGNMDILNTSSSFISTIAEGIINIDRRTNTIAADTVNSVINFRGQDGSGNILNFARISGVYDSLAGTNSAPGRISLFTCSTGSTTLNETLRVNSTGIITIYGTTASTSNTTGTLLVSGGLAISNTTDAVSSTNGGTITTAGGLAIAKSLYVGGSIASFARGLNISSSISGTPSTTGPYLQIGASTFTDNNTASSGTEASMVFNSIATPTLAATNTTVTTTNAATLYIGGGPTAGTNQTLTNSYGLWNVGNTRHDGIITSTNTTASTSNSIGSLLLSGGLAFSNTTEATSSTNGGTITTAGGVAVAKRLYIGGTTASTSTTTLNATTTNTLSATSGAITTTGDIHLYGTNPLIMLANNGSLNLPALTTRSTGTKIALYPSISGTNVDHAIGVASFTIWFSIPNTSASYRYVWYGNTSNIMQLNAQEGSLILNSTVASTSSTTGIFRCAGGVALSNTTDAVSSTNGGTITTAGGVAIAKSLYVGGSIASFAQGLNISSSLSGTPSTTGPYLKIGSSTFTDNNTASSGTAASMVFNSIGVPTLAATNTTVTTTNAATVYIAGGPTAGTNQTLTNSYGFWNVGNTRLDGIFTSTNTTASTSNTTGSLLLSGGLAIGNTTDASSSTNGGTITTAGGVAIAKKLFVGTDLSIGGNITSGVWNGTAITVPYGGTGQTTLNSNAVLLGNGTGAIQNPTTITFSSSTLTLPKITSNDTTATTSNTTGAILLSGGLAISNTTDASSSTNGGTITTAGGVAIAKNLFVGGTGGISIESVLGNRALSIQNGGSLRFAFGIAGTESGSNAGGNLNLNTYDDSGVFIATAATITRSNSTLSINGTTASTSNTTGGLLLSGGLGISNTTDASSSTNGGSITTAGGVAIAKSLYVGGSIASFAQGLNISSSLSGTPATTGPYLQIGASTFTDNNTAAAGTAASMVFNSIATPTLAATNTTVTTTNAATVYIAGGPTAGTNQTLTNSYGFWNVGNTRLDGIFTGTNATATSSSTTGAVLLSGGIAISNTADASSSTNGGSITTAGGVAIAKNLNVGGAFAVAGSMVFRTPAGAIFWQATQSTNNPTIQVGSSSASTLTVRYTATTTSLQSIFFNDTTADQAAIQYNQNLNFMNFTVETINALRLNTTNINMPYTTATTSSTTGSLLLSGGLAISNTTDASSSTNGGTITTAGGVAIAKSLYVGGTTTSTSSTTGAVILSGGLAISNTTDATSSTNGGTITTAGGAAIAKNLYVGGTTTTTSTTTGALVITGGLAISTTTEATSSSNGGCLTIAGGAALPKRIFTGSTRSGAGNIIGCNIVQNSHTYTDNTVAQDSTIAIWAFNALRTPTLAATNTNITYNNVANLYIEANPVFGTNINTTNSYGLWNGGATRLDGQLRVLSSTATTSNSTGGFLLSGGLAISNTTDSVSFTNGGTITSAGGAAFAKRVYIGDLATVRTLFVNSSASQTGTPSATGAFMSVAANTFTDSATAAAGTAATATFISFATPTLAATNTTVTTTNAATVYIAGGPIAGTNETLTNSYGLWNVGNSRVDGTTLFNNTTTSTSSTTGAVRLTGGLAISNTTDASSSTNGGTITTAGGVAIAKNLYVGGAAGISIESVLGNRALNIQNGGSLRFALGIAGTETGSNAGGNLSLYTYDDTGVFIATAATITRSNSTLSINGTTASTSNTTGGLLLSGGLAISNTTDASSSTNGGTITTAGGAAIAKDLYVGNAIYSGNGSFSNSTFFLRSFYNNDGPADIITFQTLASSPRWSITMGSGYSWNLANYDNSGVYLSDALSIDRTTAKITTSGAVHINGELFTKKTINTITNATGQTFSTAQTLNSYIARSGQNTTQTDTFPTAALLVAAITGATVGTTFTLIYKNTSANSITLAAGTGGTFYNSTTVATNSIINVTFILTNITSTTEAYDVFTK